MNRNLRTPSPLVTFTVLLPLSFFMGCQSAQPAPASAPPTPTASAPPTSTPPSVSQPASTPTPVPTATSTGGDDASTLDGVYTAAQATRGAQVFENICSECHKTEEWSDDAFRSRWQDESVFGFWYYIYEQMPNGSPPYTLTRVEVTDVLTYILELNGLPAGNAELGTDDDSIDKYWLRWAPTD